MTNAVLLASIIGASIGLAMTAFVWWLSKKIAPTPSQDDGNPFMFEETDPRIIAIQHEIAKARAKHKPVVPLLIKLNHARHDALRKELAQ